MTGLSPENRTVCVVPICTPSARLTVTEYSPAEKLWARLTVKSNRVRFEELALRVGEVDVDALDERHLPDEWDDPLLRFVAVVVVEVVLVDRGGRGR